MHRNTSLVERVLGITSDHPLLALDQAHRALTGRPCSDRYYGYFMPESGLAVSEESQMDRSMAAVYALLQRRQPKINTLTSWPTYQELFNLHGTKLTRPSTALMIGALHPLSSLSFVALAEDVYGATETIVIDPVPGVDKARHSTRFLCENGLATSLADGSVEVTHTNRLFPWLRGLSGQEATPDDFEALLAEIGRVTVSGGQLYMEEVLEEHSTPAPGQTLAKAQAEDSMALAQFLGVVLEEQGFTDVNMSFASSFTDATYLFDPTRSFDTNRVSAALGVYARKR